MVLTAALAYLAFTATAGAAGLTTPVSAAESPIAAVESQPSAAAEPVFDAQAQRGANAGSQATAPAEDVLETPQYQPETTAKTALEAVVAAAETPAISAVVRFAVSQSGVDSVSDRASISSRNGVAIAASISGGNCSKTVSPGGRCSASKPVGESRPHQVSHPNRAQYQAGRSRYQPGSKACDKPVREARVTVPSGIARPAAVKLEARLEALDQRHEPRLSVFSFASTACSDSPTAETVASAPLPAARSAPSRRVRPGTGHTVFLSGNGPRTADVATEGRALTSTRAGQRGVGSARIGGVAPETMQTPGVARPGGADVRDTGLMVQIGVLLGLVYIAFLTVWVWATRLRPRLRGGSGV